MAHIYDHPFPKLWLQVTELTVVNSPLHFNQNEYLAWLPPECPGGFQVEYRLPWHVLDTAQGESAKRLIETNSSSRPDYVRSYQTTSIFFSSELNSFLEVPYNCTIEHVSVRKRDWSDNGWGRFSFTKPEDKEILRDHPYLWLIGHGHKATQIDGKVYITDSWDNLLLPGSFANGVQQRNTLPTCELAGRLTLLLGLVAFATHRDDLLETIRQSFRPAGTTHYVPPWARNRPRDEGIVPKRGLVVEIAFDSNEYRPDQIEAWEEGRNGPILTSNPIYNYRR